MERTMKHISQLDPASPAAKARIAKAAAKMEASMMEMAFGIPRKQPQTALRMRGGRLESVELDDSGKIIESPKPCPDCGPILLCLKHMPF